MKANPSSLSPIVWKCLTAVYAVALAGCSDPCAHQDIPSGLSLDEKAQLILETCSDVQQAPSGALALKNGDETAVSVIGAADTQGTPLTEGHLVRIASVTKAITATLILQLAQEGALSLDDAVEAWVPGLPNGKRITLEHLLRMSSGLVNYTDLAEFQNEMSREWTRDELLQLVRSKGPQSEPGASFRYNNTNYMILGWIIEDVTGLTYDEALRQRLLVPAGVEHDVVLEGSARLDPSRLASGLMKDGSPVRKTCHPSLVQGAGGLVTKPAAFVKLMTWISERGLDGASLGQMRTPGKAQDFWADKAGENYGIALWRFKIDGFEVFGHPGGHPNGATSWWMFEPKSGAQVLAQYGSFEVPARTTAEAAMRALLQTAAP